MQLKIRRLEDAKVIPENPQLRNQNRERAAQREAQDWLFRWKHVPNQSKSALGEVPGAEPGCHLHHMDAWALCQQVSARAMWNNKN